MSARCFRCGTVAETETLGGAPACDDHFLDDLPAGERSLAVALKDMFVAISAEIDADPETEAQAERIRRRLGLDIPDRSH